MLAGQSELERVRGNMQPMTESEANEVWERTQESIDEHGLWEFVCQCGRVVGGMLAEFGEPTWEHDLQYLACPSCGVSEGGKFSVRYVEGDDS